MSGEKWTNGSDYEDLGGGIEKLLFSKSRNTRSGEGEISVLE